MRAMRMACIVLLLCSVILATTPLSGHPTNARTTSSFLDMFTTDANDFIALNASGSAAFTFAFDNTDSTWNYTEVYIEGPLGGIIGGGRVFSDNVSLNRVVEFVAGNVAGFTWIRISGMTNNGEQSINYVPIRIIPPNMTMDAAFFLVSSTVSSSNSSFVIKITDPQLIARARSIIENNESPLIIGTVALGWGGFNVDVTNQRVWSWHLASNSINFTDMGIELCDGTPQYVEQHLFDWIHQVGRYCPWSWTLERELTIQDVLQVIENDQEKPRITATKVVEENGFSSINVVTSDDVGINNVSAKLSLNDSSIIEIPLQPNGNGTFTLRMPTNELEIVKEITITATDFKNNSISKILPVPDQPRQQSRIISSLTIDSALFAGLIMTVIQVIDMRRRSRRPR